MSDLLRMTIGVKYSCRSCGLHRREVQVPVRGPEQDVVNWVEYTMSKALSDDHRRVSPECRATEMYEVMIPADADRIGDLRKN